MGITKNNTDVRNLREAGRIAGVVCDDLLAACRPGVTTMEIEALAIQLLGKHRSSAPFRQFEGFNHACCISLNEEVVNGPPSRIRTIKNGDLVSIAIGSEYRGMHGKAARTGLVGTNDAAGDIQRLLDACQAVFPKAMERAKEFKTLSAILSVIPECAEAHGVKVIQNTGGCGLGKKLHDSPTTPNDPADLKEDTPLLQGLAFTLMPMMTLGTDPAWTFHEDEWTYLTSDGALSAHFAETLFMGEAGLEILTRPA